VVNTGLIVIQNNIMVGNIFTPSNFLEFSHIDGRPRFAKHSFDDSKKVKIAAIDPDFY